VFFRVLLAGFGLFRLGAARAPLEVFTKSISIKYPIRYMIRNYLQLLDALNNSVLSLKNCCS